MDRVQEGDPFEGIKSQIPENAEVLNFCREANQRGFSSHEFRRFIASSLKAKFLISIEAQSEPSFFHVINEAFKHATANCNPPNMSCNSRIIYKSIATIWPDTQGDIIRRYNVVRREVRQKMNNSPSTPVSQSSFPSHSTLGVHHGLATSHPIGHPFTTMPIINDPTSSHAIIHNQPVPYIFPSSLSFQLAQPSPAPTYNPHSQSYNPIYSTTILSRV